MVVQLTDLCSPLQTLFTRNADQAAKDAEFIRRRRKLSGPVFAQALVFAWLEKPTATVDELVTALARSGVVLKTQSLEDRFTPEAAEFFRLLLSRALDKVVATTERNVVPLLRLFKGVFLLDSTSIALPAVLAKVLPGCGGRNNPDACKASLKVTVRYELAAGTLQGVNLNPGKTADATTELQAAPLPAGSLRLADLGFFDLDVLQAYDKQHVYFLNFRKDSARSSGQKQAVFQGLERLLQCRRISRVDVNCGVQCGTTQYL
jgi:hypothetical protein